MTSETTILVLDKRHFLEQGYWFVRLAFIPAEDLPGNSTSVNELTFNHTGRADLSDEDLASAGATLRDLGDSWVLGSAEEVQAYNDSLRADGRTERLSNAPTPDQAGRLPDPIQGMDRLPDAGGEAPLATPDEPAKAPSPKTSK